jgi:hypothetical protein
MDAPPKSIIEISIQNPIKAPPNFEPQNPQSVQKWNRKAELFSKLLQVSRLGKRSTQFQRKKKFIIFQENIISEHSPEKPQKIDEKLLCLIWRKFRIKIFKKMIIR